MRTRTKRERWKGGGKDVQQLEMVMCLLFGNLSFPLSLSLSSQYLSLMVKNLKWLRMIKMRAVMKV